MDLELSDKVALVTGSSRGIGRATAISLAKEGCRLVLCARGESDLKRAEAEVGALAEVTSITADVTTEQGCAAAVSAAERAFGQLDVVVANIGGSGARSIDESDEVDFSDGIDRNLRPAYRISRAALPLLRKQEGGVIALVSSIYGRESGGAIAYNVAKSGVIALAKAMARDLARDHIRVFSVAPGSILFPGSGWDRRQKADPAKIAAFVERDLPFGRFGTAEEVGDVIAFLCSKRANWIAGSCIPIDGAQSHAF